MKIAILLFGHLRSFECASKYTLENIINRYDCDVFIHTWDTIESQTKSWNNKKQCDLKVDDKLCEKIHSIYSPKSLLIEKQNISEDTLVSSSDGKKILSLKGMQNMFYSMKKVNDLKNKYKNAHNIHYDYVFVTRPDVAIFNYIDIEKIDKEASFLGIDLNNIRFYAGLYGNSNENVSLLCNRVNDLLFFAKEKVIDRYIKANINLKKEDIDKTFINAVSIYTKNEIQAGITPVQICFEVDIDWKNIALDKIKKIKRPSFKKSKLYKFLHLYSWRKKD